MDPNYESGMAVFDETYDAERTYMLENGIGEPLTLSTEARKTMFIGALAKMKDAATTIAILDALRQAADDAAGMRE